MSDDILSLVYKVTGLSTFVLPEATRDRWRLISLPQDLDNRPFSVFRPYAAESMRVVCYGGNHMVYHRVFLVESCTSKQIQGWLSLERRARWDICDGLSMLPHLKRYRGRRYRK